MSMTEITPRCRYTISRGPRIGTRCFGIPSNNEFFCNACLNKTSVNQILSFLEQQKELPHCCSASSDSKLPLTSSFELELFTRDGAQSCETDKQGWTWTREMIPIQ